MNTLSVRILYSFCLRYLYDGNYEFSISVAVARGN